MIKLKDPPVGGANPGSNGLSIRYRKLANLINCKNNLIQDSCGEE